MNDKNVRFADETPKNPDVDEEQTSSPKSSLDLHPGPTPEEEEKEDGTLEQDLEPDQQLLSDLFEKSTVLSIPIRRQSAEERRESFEFVDYRIKSCLPIDIQEVGVELSPDDAPNEISEVGQHSGWWSKGSRHPKSLNDMPMSPDEAEHSEKMQRRTSWLGYDSSTTSENSESFKKFTLQTPTKWYDDDHLVDQECTLAEEADPRMRLRAASSPEIEDDIKQFLTAGATRMSWSGHESIEENTPSIVKFLERDEERESSSSEMAPLSENSKEEADEFFAPVIVDGVEIPRAFLRLFRVYSVASSEIPTDDDDQHGLREEQFSTAEYRIKATCADRWLEDAKILDHSNVTVVHTSLCYFFNETDKVRAMSIQDFLHSLSLVARFKKMPYSELIDRLAACPEPQEEVSSYFGDKSKTSSSRFNTAMSNFDTHGKKKK